MAVVMVWCWINQTNLAGALCIGVTGEATKQADMQASRMRAGTGSRKCNCPFIIETQELPGGTWRGRIIEEHHNHQGTEQVTSHPVHRRRAQTRG